MNTKLVVTFADQEPNGWKSAKVCTGELSSTLTQMSRSAMSIPASCTKRHGETNMHSRHGECVCASLPLLLLHPQLFAARELSVN